MIGETKACPVCCHGFGRDGIMRLKRDTKGELRFVCETRHPLVPNDCGFSFPVGTSAKKIKQLANERIAELRAMGALER